LGKVLLGQGLGVFTLLLGALSRPFQSFEPQITVVKRRHDLARLHHVTGARLRIGKISGDRRREGALGRALKAAVCRYMVLTLGKQEKDGCANRREGPELQADVTRPEQSNGQVGQAVEGFAAEPAILLALEVQDRAEQHADMLTE